MHILELEDHNVNELTLLRDVETNWEKVDRLLEQRRKDSLSFIKQALTTD